MCSESETRERLVAVALDYTAFHLGYGAELFELNEEGSLNIINFLSFDNQNKIHIGSSAAELEKQLAINELQVEKLAMKDREIAYLKELLDMHKQQKPILP